MGAVLWAALMAVGLSAPAQADGGCPAGEPCVVVRDHGSTGQSYVLDPATLDQIGDVTQQQYRTYTGQGGVRDEPFVGRGASVTAILAHLGLTATRVTAQAGPSAHQTQLDQADLGTDYPGGLTPVFFSDSPSFIRFVRPMRSADDANYQDYWSGDSDGAVYLDVYSSGHVLHPVITASAGATKAGEAVSFSVTLNGSAPPGVSYAWDFGDGSASSAAAPTHAWRRPGSAYAVNLTVTGSDGSSGTAPPVTVRVGKAPRKTSSPKPGTGTAGSHNPVTGPATGGGHHGGGMSTGNGTASTGSPTAAPAPASPSPSPSPRPRKKRAPVVVAGDRVEGVLLVSSTSGSVTTPTSPSVQAPRRAAAARAVGTTPGRRPLWWLLALPAVVALGALGQSRWWWRRRPTAPWMISG